MTGKNAFMKAALLSTALVTVLTPSFAAANHTNYGMTAAEINSRNYMHRQEVNQQHKRQVYNRGYGNYGGNHGNHGHSKHDQTLDNIQHGINFGIQIFRNSR